MTQKDRDFVTGDGTDRETVKRERMYRRALIVYVLLVVLLVVFSVWNLTIIA